MRLTTILKWVAGGSLLAMVGAYIGAVVLPFYFRGVEVMFAGLGLLLPFSISSLACAATLELGRVRMLMRSGIGASALAWVGWMVYIWLQSTSSWDAAELTAALAGTVTAWAMYCMVLGLLMRYRMSIVLSMISRVPTIIVTSILLVAAIGSIWFGSRMWSSEQQAFRFFQTTAILTAVGVLLTIVLARLRQLTGEMDDDDDNVPRIDFTLWCPRCEMHQPFTTGGGLCRRCGLAIKVTPP